MFSDLLSELVGTATILGPLNEAETLDLVQFHQAAPQLMAKETFNVHMIEDNLADQIMTRQDLDESFL
jgi:hypothetical protein